MGVVEGLGDRGDDVGDLPGRHSVALRIGDQMRGVGALDVIHRDPDLSVVFAAVVHTDDVRVPQR